MSLLRRCCIFQLRQSASSSQSRSFKILRAQQLPNSFRVSAFSIPLSHLFFSSFYSSHDSIAMSSAPETVENAVTAAVERPSTPPEKRVIHSQNPTSPPPETSAAKKVRMSAPEETTPATAAPAADNAPAVTSVAAEPSLLIKKLNDKARTPKRGSAFAAGYDMYACEDTVIPKGGKGLVETGLSMAIPDGCYGRVAPRSGLASKNFIDTGAGVIDADYRGPVKILLFNHSDVDFEVKEGDRVAQLILERIYTPEIVVVEDLEESVRGAGGFGSSGR